MPAYILQTGLLFGHGFEPPAKLLAAGFLLIQQVGEFAIARRDARDYLIKVSGKTLELWEICYDGEKTKGNPRGMYLGADRPSIVIPIETAGVEVTTLPPEAQ